LEFGLPEHGAIYFCPQRIEKLHPAFDRLLQGVLEADSHGSIVMLKGRYPSSFERLVLRFRATLGPTLLKRVIFFPNLPASQYYRLFSLASVVLDTPNYSASLTGFDAISLGVPIVTLPGVRNVERYAYAIYRKLGMMDLVADTEEQYVAAATRLGRNEPYLRHMREQIEERSSRLFADVNTIREHERFFEEVHRQ
jgi:predicted O-linked N-acetylglucosamine transferase (SPINDLY family)